MHKVLTNLTSINLGIEKVLSSLCKFYILNPSHKKNPIVENPMHIDAYAEGEKKIGSE